MAFFGLLLLSFILSLLLVYGIYLVFHNFLRDLAPRFEDFAPQYARKLQKKRPPPLELVAVRGDVEAQTLRLVAVGGDEGARPGAVRSHEIFHFGGVWGNEEDGREMSGGVATGVDADGEGLTPFTPARARARKYGEGVVEARDVDEEEDELGLGKYFFGNGVGIMRYESTAKARGWKDG